MELILRTKAQEILGAPLLLADCYAPIDRPPIGLDESKVFLAIYPSKDEEITREVLQSLFRNYVDSNYWYNEIYYKLDVSSEDEALIPTVLFGDVYQQISIEVIKGETYLAIDWDDD